MYLLASVESYASVLVALVVGAVTIASTRVILRRLSAKERERAHKPATKSLREKLAPVLPYLIPRHNIKVQLCLATCIACMIGERFLSVAIPRQAGRVADALASGVLPYRELTVYMVLTLLHNESGFGLVVSLAKIPILRHSSRQLVGAAFSHILSLSADFHADANAGEIIKAIEQGGVLTTILESVVLDIVPTVVDVFVALVVFYLKFGLPVSMYMFVASVVFVVLESTTASWNLNRRRTAATLQRRETTVMHEALQNWQTVASFNAFAYETQRCGLVVDARLAASGEYEKYNALVRAFRQALIPIFFFVLSCLVARDRPSAGDYAFLMQYWEYLIWPLKLLSHSCRQLLAHMVDAERFLDLLNTQPSVYDAKSAVSLREVAGSVSFEHVCFSYDDGRRVLHDITARVEPGQTVALVGATGSGKSTLAKLLMRLYTAESGTIAIDGHDVRSITLGSLRDAISVVPQKPQLFNASVLDNVRYARMTASEDDVYAACRMAAVHDDILMLTHGYDTVVGADSAKLSGGQVQRLALARAFLRDAPIVILDEATSAVDSKTEAKIHEALLRLREKRTVFIIAHRLQTIVGADQILVLSEGRVIERGLHSQLVERKGVYHQLWQRSRGK